MSDMHLVYKIIITKDFDLKDFRNDTYVWILSDDKIIMVCLISETPVDRRPHLNLR